MQPANVMSSEKSPVRIIGFDELEFAPRFEFGEMIAQGFGFTRDFNLKGTEV
jgi:hypothetical protein